VDAGVSRSAASSATAGTSLALLEPDRFIAALAVAGFTTDFAADFDAGFATAVAAGCRAARVAAAFAARAGAGEAAGDFRAAVAAALDVFLAELAAPASLTLLVGAADPLPAAVFPPVVFAIAIPP